MTGIVVFRGMKEGGFRVKKSEKNSQITRNLWLVQEFLLLPNPILWMGRWCCCFPSAITKALEHRKPNEENFPHPGYLQERTEVNPNSTGCQNTMYYSEVIDNVFSLKSNR